jgi:peptidoglycan/LPS O-acetylase OafA/YrhL
MIAPRRMLCRWAIKTLQSDARDSGLLTLHYRKEIDGLRACAIIPVILFHSGMQTMSGGFIGVDVFFVISGYLITTLIASERQLGTFSVLTFYERRARRILPALFLVMFFSIPFAWLWLLPADRKMFSASIGAITLFSSNIVFWQEADYFGTAAELKPLLHTWSLAVEEQYYVLFPALLAFVWRLGRRWVVILLALLMIASYMAAFWASRTHPTLSFFLLPTRAWEILTGALVAFFLATNGESMRKKRIGEIPSLLGICSIAGSALLLDRYFPYPSQYTVIPVLGTVLVIVFATPETLVGRLLGSPPVVGIGLISYSAYLWHQPLFAFARNYSVDEPSGSLMAVLAIAALFLGYLSWKFIETPFRVRGQRGFTRKQVFALGLGCSAIFLVVGFAGYVTNGFETNSERTLASYAKYPHKNYDKDGVCLLAYYQTYKDFSTQCAPPNSVGGTLIWGDSYAAALSFGLRKYFPKLIQYTANGCPPIKDLEIKSRPDCKAINDYALLQIEMTQPHIAFLDANWTLYQDGGRIEDLSKTIDYIRRVSPSTAITIIGPVPQWRPTLPAAMMRQKIEVSADIYLRPAIFGEVSAVDAALRAQTARRNVTFFSALQALCDNDKCLATTQLNGVATLTAWDSGHLTAGGAVFLARKLLESEM